jgi:hypothetical protein
MLTKRGQRWSEERSTCTPRDGLSELSGITLDPGCTRGELWRLLRDGSRDHLWHSSVGCYAVYGASLPLRNTQAHPRSKGNTSFRRLSRYAATGRRLSLPPELLVSFIAPSYRRAANIAGPQGGWPLVGSDWQAREGIEHPASAMY